MGEPLYKRKEEFTVTPAEWQVAIDYFKAHPGAVKFAKKDDPTQKQQNSFVKVGDKLYALSNTRFLKKFGGNYGWVKVAIEQPHDFAANEKPKYVAIKIEGQDVRGNLNPEAIAATRAGLMKGEASRTVDPDKIYKTEEDQAKFGGKEFKLYTVMDWLEGNDLDKTIENNTSLTDTQRWLLSLGAAVELMRLQKLGIVHGDVKAANYRVELDANNNPKRITAMDYGLSKIIPEGEDRIDSDYQDGSPGYKAPEISGNMYFKTTDNYALAVTFLTDTHLAGKKEDWLKDAFTEEVIQNETAPNPSNLIVFLENNDFKINPPTLKKLLMGMLNPDPEKRTQLTEVIAVLCSELKTRTDLNAGMRLKVNEYHHAVGGPKIQRPLPKPPTDSRAKAVLTTNKQPPVEIPSKPEPTNIKIPPKLK